MLKQGVSPKGSRSMVVGRPIPPLVLSDYEVQQLQNIANSKSLPPFHRAVSTNWVGLRSRRNQHSHLQADGLDGHDGG